MGTDYVQLMDRQLAETIINGTDDDLIAIVDSRSKPNAGPPVWRQYWDPGTREFLDFDSRTPLPDRLARIRMTAAEPDLRKDLIRELCISDWIYLDYWSCYVEVFGSASAVFPPGATLWEDFIAPINRGNPPAGEIHRDEDGGVLWVETSGAYLLTQANTAAMLQSLQAHAHELEVMTPADVDRLSLWHRFCGRHNRCCVVYQMDL